MKIYNKDISNEEVLKLILEVKSGKYKSIGDEKVKAEILKELKNNPSKIDLLSKKRNREEFVKLIKTKLYKGIGVFSKGKSLESHHSTKDRSKGVYKKIFSMTGECESIVDIGCGVHALSYEDFGITPKYVGYEINQEQVGISNAYFKEKGINGEVFCKDVLQLKKFPKADVYFLFQVLDSLEQTKNHKISEWLLDSVDAKFIIVSFSSLTLSGNPMNVPERRWFNLLLERKGFLYEKFSTSNEIFYVIEKKNE